VTGVQVLETKDMLLGKETRGLWQLVELYIGIDANYRIHGSNVSQSQCLSVVNFHGSDQ
jgi:hypothetical protein